MPIENIDTDQIIPARFLKATTRDGFGKNLFRDWRYNNDDELEPKTDFVLNHKIYSGEILVAGKNFGCGSSREHAAWAIKDYGFKVVISSGAIMPPLAPISILILQMVILASIDNARMAEPAYSTK